MSVLEELIEKLTQTTTLDKKTIERLFKQELENCEGDEILAAEKVHRRIDFYLI